MLFRVRRAERNLLSYERCGWLDDTPSRLTGRQVCSDGCPSWVTTRGSQPCSSCHSGRLSGPEAWMMLAAPAPARAAVDHPTCLCRLAYACSSGAETYRNTCMPTGVLLCTPVGTCWGLLACALHVPHQALPRSNRTVDLLQL